MARKRPYDPSKAARAAAKAAQAELDRKRQDFGAVNLQPDAASLLSQQSIQITRTGAKRDGQVVQENSVRRLDAFAALKESMEKGAFDAARRLERDMRMRRGDGDKGQRVERVDCDGKRDLTDLIITAGQNCDSVKSRLSPRDWWLLVEMIDPAVSRDGWCKIWKDEQDVEQRAGPFYGWRAHVAYITGEINPNAQGAAVRAACVNLRDTYEALDVAPRKAA
jgi:hypothetical protein